MKTFTCKQEIPNELLDHDPNIVNYVIENMVNELAKGIADVLSDGELYAIQMKKHEIDGLGALNQNCTAYRSTVEFTPIKWIPCSERQPRVLQKAMACNKHGEIMIGTYTEWGWMFPCYFEKPIAWMPIPEPYKENEDG